MSLPTGTITFLFTDIEGSTLLLQQLGETYGHVLADHHRLLRAAFARGYEFGTQGDALLVVFKTAGDAVASAVAAQRALKEHPWPAGLVIRVRMGLHTGEPEISGGDYVGLDVHRAARICSAAHGGQILLSRTTRDLTRLDLRGGVALRDLGRHRLKDLEHSEHLYQLLHPDLPADFPPVRSLDSLNNLPRRLTSFIGREDAIKEIKQLLGGTQLLSLVGTGGAGKTRLALQVAGDLLGEYEHGVWLVKLALVTDPALVPQAVASALGQTEEPGLTLTATLSSYLRARHLLLVLDNCEHLVDAVAQLVESLLASSPRLQILCTSREALGISGETAWRVPSLSVPDPRLRPPLEALKESEAVRLFLERAADVLPGFTLTTENAAAIIQICRRLDGVPLAIELAASRVKVLTVEQIAARLDDRFQLLTGGSRTALPRQQALRAAMDWSYDLLTAQEAAVLRRLSVFNGGCTLEAAEDVCAGESVERREVLDLLARLVDKSLVVVEDDGREARYRLLETVRQYGLEKLVASAEASAVRARHLDWVLAMAEAAEAHLHGPEQAMWLNRLDQEHDNCRAALEWAIGRADSEAALRLADVFWWFWTVRGYITEGREWMDKALASASEPNALRARVLTHAGVLTYFADDLAGAERLAQQGLALSRQLEDLPGVGMALAALTLCANFRGDRTHATALAQEAVDIFRAHRCRWELASSLSVMGMVALQEGDFVQGGAHVEESLSLFRELGDLWGIAFAQRWMGLLARTRGDYEQAAALQKDSLELNQALGHQWGVAVSLMTMALVPLRQGEYARAAGLLEEGLTLFRETRDRYGVAEALYYLGLTAYYQGNHTRAQAMLEESLSKFREVGARDGGAQALASLGRVALQQDDPGRALSLGQQSLAMLGASGRRWPRAYALRLLGGVALRQGDFSRAEDLARESLEIFRALGDRWAVAWALQVLGEIGLAKSEYDEAKARFAESLQGRQRQGDKMGMAEALEGLAAVLARLAPSEDAARLLGAAEALRDEIAAPLPPVDADWYKSAVGALRVRLPAEAIEIAWAQGRDMTPRDAVALALAEDGAAAGPSDRR
ncbi:MAG: ATP-binding protein [Armatimonadota bacterium]